MGVHEVGGKNKLCGGRLKHTKFSIINHFSDERVDIPAMSQGYQLAFGIRCLWNTTGYRLKYQKVEGREH